VGILRAIRALPGAIQDLTTVFRDALDWHTVNAPAEARLEDLERSRTVWEARMEGELLKADSTYKSASNAESRARTMARHDEKLLDPFPDEGDKERQAVPADDVEGSKGGGVLPLRMDVEAADPKAAAMIFKYPHIGG